MRRIKALAIFNAVSFIIQVIFTYFAQSGYFSNLTVGAVSARHETLVTPAGLTFAIWGVIYTSLAILCLYHIIMAYKHDLTNPANHELSRMGNLFILLNLGAAAWLVAWTREIMLLSVILIFFQLICLIIIHIRLHIYSPTKAASVKVAMQFPLSIYLAWISMATVANMASFLSSTGWDGFGVAGYQWAIGMIAVALIISAFMILARRDVYFGLVTAWFLFGLVKKREGISGVENESIVITAYAGIGIMLLLSIYQLVKNVRYKNPREIFPVGTPLK
jgi:hypothetical protein